ncbi:MAG: guanylate kinase [Candidatus Omnitrophota bacterium]|nr:guanylate kinase [Candidatus Omnitrophota bacterium]
MRKQSEKQGLIFIISGPSGSGKTTLAEKILGNKRLKNKLARSISFTTRPKRSGEQDKKDYFFISGKRFKREQKAKKILEWTKYLGYYYATPKDFIERQLHKAKHIILCLDLKGAFSVKRQYPGNTVTIFVIPPSLDTLLQRITSRCNKTKEGEVRQRLRLAQQELSACEKYDYCVVNKDLNQAIKELQGIILKEITYLKNSKE